MLRSIFPESAVRCTSVEDDIAGSDLDVLISNTLVLRVDCKLEQRWSWEDAKRLTNGAPGVPLEVLSNRMVESIGWIQRVPEKSTSHFLFGFRSAAKGDTAPNWVGILVDAKELHALWLRKQEHWAELAACGAWKQFNTTAYGYYVPIEKLVKCTSPVVVAIVRRGECIFRGLRVANTE